MDASSTRRATVLRLAEHLRARRPAILQAWHAAVARDPDITTAATLARREFIDHVPRILDAFDQQLQAQGEDARAIDAQRRGAAEHGLERWRHGYHYRETMREWGHLQVAVGNEVEAFTCETEGLDPAGMSTARMLLTQLFVDCMVESAAGHVRLTEVEAAGRLRDLEQVLAEVRGLEQRRADLWREAAHDLRGTVGAVQLAAAALARDRMTPRPAAADAVERASQHLVALLDDLVALARLEAGREERRIAAFDPVETIGGVCRGLEPSAAARGLTLSFVAPAGLSVEGDAVKVGRIVQNLVVNAIRYTEQGRIDVTVRAARRGAADAWEVCVEDTGVGLSDRASPAIATVLRIATREALPPTADSPPRRVPPRTSSPAAPAGPGEGVGLAIVKRLCELLDATIDVDSAPGHGTRFSIVFPASYGDLSLRS